jgi:hypothetical protein
LTIAAMGRWKKRRTESPRARRTATASESLTASARSFARSWTVATLSLCSRRVLRG